MGSPRLTDRWQDPASGRWIALEKILGVLPEDWEPWNAETIRRMEEEDRAEQEMLHRRLLEEAR